MSLSRSWAESMTHVASSSLQAESPIQDGDGECGMFVILNAEHVCNTWSPSMLWNPCTTDEAAVVAGGGRRPLAFQQATMTMHDARGYRACMFAMMTCEWLRQRRVQAHGQRWNELEERLKVIPSCMQQLIKEYDWQLSLMQWTPVNE